MSSDAEGRFSGDRGVVAGPEAPAAGTTQAEGITICAFSIATVIEASVGRSGGGLASA